MLGIDRDEKKRRHFTLLHENIEFRYHNENHGKIYWACKVAGCPGMVEEDHYKMKLIRNHDHSRAVKIPPSKRWQSNPWYHNDTTDNYKYDPTEAYNINNSIKTTKLPKPAPIPPSWHSKGDNRTPRFYHFNMPPSKSQTKSIPASVVRGYPPGGLKRNYHDSDPHMSDGTESLRSMMECNTYRQQRFWIVMGILGLVALSIVAIALSFYFIDKSRFNNHMVKHNNGVMHQNASVEPITSTTESTSQATSQQQDTTTRVQTDRNTLTTQQTSTQTKAAGTSTEATSTSRVTSPTLPPTQTTPPPSASLSTAPIVFSGSLKLNKSWTPALNDSASSEYQVFSKAIVYEIDTAFLTSPMKHIFNNSKVTGYSPGSVKVFFKITFYTVVKEDGQVDMLSVNVTDVQQTIEREVTRQQTTRTNGFLGAVMAESITIKLVNAPVVFIGDLSLNEAWNDGLNDPSSPIFQNLTSRLKEELLASLMNSIQNEFLDVQIMGFRKGSINVIFKIIMTVNTTQDTPLIEVSSVIQAIQSEANRQLQEAVTGLLQKLISLSVENQTIANATTSAPVTTSQETPTTQPTTTTTLPTTTSTLPTTKTTQPTTTTTQPTTTKTLPTTTTTQPTTTTTQPTTTTTQPTTTTTQPITTTTLSTTTTTTITQPTTTTTQPTITTQPTTTTSQPTTTTIQPTTMTTLPTTTTTQPTTTTTQPTTTTTQPTTTTTLPTTTTTLPTTTTIQPTTTTTLPTTTTTQPTTTTTQPTTKTTLPTTTTTKPITTTTQPTTTTTQPTTTTTQPTTTTTQPTTTITQPATTTTQPTTTKTLPTTTTTQPTTTTTQPTTTTTQPTTKPTLPTTTTTQPTTTTTQTTTTTTLPSTTTTLPTTTTTQSSTTTIQPTTTTTLPTTTTTQPTTTTTQPTTTTTQPTTTTTLPTTTTSQPTTTTTQPTTTTTLPTTTTTQPTTTTSQTTTTTTQPTMTTQPTTTTTLSTTTTTTTTKSTTTTTQPTTTTTTQPTTTTSQPTTTTTQPTTTTTLPTTTTTLPTTTTTQPTTTTTQPTTTTTLPTTTTTQPTTTTTQPTTTTTLPTTTTSQPTTTTTQSTTTTTQPTTTTTQPTTTTKQSTTTTIQPTTTTTLPTTTQLLISSSSMIITPAAQPPVCQEKKSISTKGWFCALPYYTDLTTKLSSNEFCRIMRDIFTCIVNNVETDYNVTCLPETVETVAGIYGPTLQSTFEMPYSLKQCDFRPVVETTVQSTLSSTPDSTTVSYQETTSTTQSTLQTQTTTTTISRTSPMTTTSLTTPVTTSLPRSKCRESNIIITKGWNCVVPQVINITKALDFDKFCSIVKDVFDCIMDGIEKQFNVSCDQNDTTIALELFSPMLTNAFSLKNNPADCYIVTTTQRMTTTVMSTPEMTSSNPPTPTPISTLSETVSTITTSLTPNPLLAKCKDSGVVLDKSLQCVLPYFEQISTAKDNETFCRVVDQIFQCIIDKIESEFGVTCSGKDKELAILSYGPTLQSSLSLSFAPTKCEFETTTITTPYIPSSAVPESKTTSTSTSTTWTTGQSTTTLPPSSQITVPITTPVSSTTTLSPLQLNCHDEAEIMARGWQCALPLYSNLTTSSDLPEFCLAVGGVIECILSDIGYIYGVNCSRSDQQNALSFYGPTLQSSLPLGFNPTNCSLGSDGISVVPVTIGPETPSRVTSFPVTVSSPVLPSTESLSLSVCKDTTLILSKGWVCALPRYMDISTTNDVTAFCRATESVFTCILDSISSEHGVTCTASYKDTVIETYSPNLRSISTASLDPRQCYITTTTPTTTTESPLLAKCQDSATITSAAYFCFLPLYINMTTATDKLEFCSVIEAAFSCIVKKIEADYSIRCREGDKEKMISNYGADLTTSLKLKFDPLNDCYNMSEKHIRIARFAGIAQYSPCQDHVELLAKGLYCLDLFHQKVSQLLKESSFERFCSGIEIFSSCVMTEMGKKLKGSCNEVEQEIFISNHSISLEKTFGLAFKPADCFMASTTTVETTTTSPPSLCLDSELIYVKLMLCAGPVFSSLKSEKKFTSFCGLFSKVFGCIIDRIESSENITCSKSDDASIAQLHGSEIHRRLALPFNPADCYQPASTTTEPITQPSSTTLSTVTETSTQPSTSTATKTSTLSSIDSFSTKHTTISISTETTSNPTTIEPSPCRDLNKVNMFILPCIGPVFSFISSTKNSTNFCGLMMRVFDCIVNKTENDGNVTCSLDDKKELMEAIGLQMNKTLPLPFSPELCTFLLEKPLVESTPASVTNITTPVDSISLLMTTASTTLVTTEPSPCQDVNKMNMFILPCIGPLFFTISSAKNATAFCGYIVEVFDCIINKTEVEANRTCSQKDARKLVQTIGLQMNKTLPFNINPMLCSGRYGYFDTTTTTTSEFTTISLKDSKCKSKSEIFSQGIHCIGPYYKFLMTATQYGAVCSFLQLTFNCIFERIEKQHNVTCPSLVRNEAKAMYAVDVYKGLPLKFQPDSCPGNISCFIEVGRPEYRECFETFFIFEKYNGSIYNLKLSENEICSAYWGMIMCLQNRDINCGIEDTHKILSQYLLDSNASITIPTACSKNTTLGRTLCADDDFPLLTIQAKCGFYPILIPFDCDRHGWEYIKCAAESLDPLKCNADSIYGAVTVLMQANRSFFDRINPGRGEEVYSCINKTTFNWIATYKPNEDENNQPPRPLPEVIKTGLSITISDVVWTSDLLDPSSGHYRSVASYVMNNLTIAFGSEPEILQIEIVSFRRTIIENVTTVDLEITFNTTSLSSIDLQPKNDTNPDLFYNLNVVSVSEFSMNTRNSSCPAVTSESMFCNDTCKDDFYCQSFEKCCSTGCGRTCQNSTDFRTNYTDYLSYPISRVLPKNAAQLLFSVTLPDFNWTNALLDPWSPYYKEIHAGIIRNFKQQMQNSQEFLYYDVLSFREGRFVIADIILTYDKYLITSSSVVNDLYMLHRHGFIQNLKIQGDVSYDKLVKPGSCPYPSLAILRSCSDTCTGDTACSRNLKCCFNGCARTCVTPGYVYALQLTTTEETFSSTPASGNTLQPSSSPSKVLRMSFVLKLVDYTWSSDLLQSSSDYYQKLKSTVIQNFNVQFSGMPGYLGVEVVSFRVGGPFVDLVITYAPPATDYATVLNTVFLLTKHGYIHYLHVHNYLHFDHVVKTGTCPPVLGLGPCNMNCTGDSKCPGKQKCCSNGCGLTCSDMIITSPRTTNPPTTKPTTRPATIPTTTTPSTTLTSNPTTIPTTVQIPIQPETVSLLSVTIELQENTWNTSLLDPRSFYYQSLYSTIKTNILQLFRLKPGITDVFIQSFRSRNQVDLILNYNTESIALIDIITTLIAARSSGAIHDLKIHHYMTFDTQMKPGDCPAVLVSCGACLESCMGDGTCPGVEKCCSTGCGRVCTSVYQPV